MVKADLLAMVFRRPTTPNGAGVHANRERRCGRLVLPGSNCYLIEISKRTVALFDHRLEMLIIHRWRPPFLRTAVGRSPCTAFYSEVSR